MEVGATSLTVNQIREFVGSDIKQRWLIPGLNFIVSIR
jgi:hypothetical protein